MDAYTLRRENLRQLAGRYRADHELAEALEWDPSLLSRRLGGNRQIGHRAARQVEERLGLKPGWLDIPHPATPADTELLASVENFLSRQPDERLTRILSQLLQLLP